MTIENFSSVPIATNERGYFTPDSKYGKARTLNTTDTVFQNIQVYIEGVEVPFSTVIVNQALGQMPSCMIDVPPHPGLMEICKYYNPKVHIFFTDLDTGQQKVLFWGVITAAMFYKSVSGGGSSSVSFRCVHRNQALRDYLLYFGNSSTMNNGTDHPVGYQMMDDLRSENTVLKALTGISGYATGTDELVASNDGIETADVNKLDQALQEFEKRLIGIPATIMVMWNIVKKAALRRVESNLTTLTIYMPLFEQGLSYFKRMSGHYLLEKKQDESRMPYCPEGQTPRSIMVAPWARTGFVDAVQSELTVGLASQQIGFSGDFSGFIDMCENFLLSLDYEIITLASPAEVPTDPESLGTGEVSASANLMAIDTVIKPSLPYYYSPICNVIYPRMITTVEASQDDGSIPTRVVIYQAPMPSGGATNAITTNFEGPSSIREAISVGNFLSGSNTNMYDLRATTGRDPNVPGRFEQGKGVRPLRVSTPWWLTQISADKRSSSANTTLPPENESNDSDYQRMRLISKSWQDRIGYDIVYNSEGSDAGAFNKVRNTAKDTLNPFNFSYQIPAWQRMMFASVDYRFASAVMQSRQGSVQGVFNPYIVVGYPMDVLDPTPGNPSFHALCTSVTHTITSRSITTTVGMNNVMTYAELTNYYNPPLAPWLQIALGVVNSDVDPTAAAAETYGSTEGMGPVRSTIVQNPEARKVADEFYRSVFGVGAADPSELMDFGTGQIIPQGRDESTGTIYANAAGNTSIKAPNGGEMNDWLTSMGNLRLVKRPIETREAISAKMSSDDVQYQFIDMTASNYESTPVEYSNPYLDENFLLEPGASLFLDYEETADFVAPAKKYIKTPSG